MKILCCLLLLAPFASAQTAVPATPTPIAVKVAHMEIMLEDWPNLSRYRAENAALAAPVAGENRVVFMGDSIFDLWGHGSAFFPGRPYVNRGISGQTTPQMLLRFRPDVIALEPKAVVILAGTNDIAGNTGPSTPRMIEDNLTSMAELARASHIRVVLASILPAAAYPWKPGIDPIARIRALNGWIESYCRANHCVYLDYYSAMADAGGGMKKDLSQDGVHPNAAGYALMAPLTERAIAQALGVHPADPVVLSGTK